MTKPFKSLWQEYDEERERRDNEHCRREREEQRRVSEKTWGMGCNE